MQRRTTAHSVMRANTRIKAVRALQMRVEGKTLHQIGSELGVSYQRAAQFIEMELEERGREPADTIRQLELQRLDELLKFLWKRAKASEGLDHAVTDRILRVMDRRAKYLGLDAPIKIDMQGELQKLSEQYALSDEDRRAAVAEAERILADATKPGA